ncbi:MAG TPA: pilin, partial [Candidatus Saccharimonadia bacterium]|nr:pilin [Candidatus Saccharimonadia bacterium]
TNSLNNAVVFDKQVASPNTNPKSRFTETVIEVECANGAPKKPSSGMAVTGISCSGGGSVTYLGAKTFSSSTSGRTPTSNGGVGSGGSGSSSSGSSSSTGSTSGGKSNVPQPITAPIPAAQPDPAIKCTAPTTNSGGSSTTSSSKNTGSSTCCTTSQCDLIAKYVNPTINLLAAVFGTIAVLSIIIGGINFSTSEGDPQKAGRAKQRITNTVIALVAFIFFYAFLQFLIPGGLFNK